LSWENFEERMSNTKNVQWEGEGRGLEVDATITVGSGARLDGSQ